MSLVSLAEKIMAAARTVCGVADTDSAAPPRVATYGPGGRAPHVALRPTRSGFAVEVHLSALYDPDVALFELADRIRAAIRERVDNDLGDRSVERIDIAFDDIVEREVDPCTSSIEA